MVNYNSLLSRGEQDHQSEATDHSGSRKVPPQERLLVSMDSGSSANSDKPNKITPLSIMNLKRSDSSSSFLTGLKTSESQDSVRSRQGSANAGGGKRFVSLFSALLKGGGKRQMSVNSIVSSSSTDDLKDRYRPTSINDFEILKPISRGAFG